jgi:hypothetical protein
MKLINKLFVLLSPVLLMAEDSVCQKTIFGTNVSLINIFWMSIRREGAMFLLMSMSFL